MRIHKVAIGPYVLGMDKNKTTWGGSRAGTTTDDARRVLAGEIGISIRMAIDGARARIALVRSVIGQDEAQRLLAVLRDIDQHLRDLDPDYQ